MKRYLSAYLLAALALTALTAHAQKSPDTTYFVTDCFTLCEPDLLTDEPPRSYPEALRYAQHGSTDTSAEHALLEQLQRENLALQFDLGSLQLQVELLSRRLAALEAGASAAPAETAAGKQLQ